MSYKTLKAAIDLQSDTPRRGPWDSFRTSVLQRDARGDCAWITFEWPCDEDTRPLLQLALDGHRWLQDALSCDVTRVLNLADDMLWDDANVDQNALRVAVIEATESGPRFRWTMCAAKGTKPADLHGLIADLGAELSSTALGDAATLLCAHPVEDLLAYVSELEGRSGPAQVLMSVAVPKDESAHTKS